MSNAAAMGTPHVDTQAASQQMQVALQHHQAGRLRQANDICRQIIHKIPNHPDALNLSGIVAHQMGNSELAAELISKAINSRPSEHVYYSNLGNVLREQYKLEEAAASYRQALLLNPNYAEAYNNLGVVLKAQGQLDEAAASYRQALFLKPNYAEAYNNLGNVLKEQSKLDDSAASYRQALLLNPNYAEANNNLGVVLLTQGKWDEALACFQQQIRLVPGNNMALHLIASLTGNTTERAPIQYVEELFDGYAERFDAHLVQHLKYETPEKLVALITQRSTPPAEKWNVLDLGCGTGLVALAIAPFARQLVGVDLSANMLKRAQERDLYLRLERLDLLTMMRGEMASSYDVIVAADVFVYLGKLDDILREVRRLLCPAGIFAFSVEALEALSIDEGSIVSQREYQLKHSGRYAHSADYLTRLASANDFRIQEMRVTQLRVERETPVNGYLALWENGVS